MPNHVLSRIWVHFYDRWSIKYEPTYYAEAGRVDEFAHEYFVVASVLRVWMSQLSSFLLKLQECDFDLLIWLDEVRTPVSPLSNHRARSRVRYGRLFKMIDPAVKYFHQPIPLPKKFFFTCFDFCTRFRPCGESLPNSSDVKVRISLILIGLTIGFSAVIGGTHMGKQLQNQMTKIF